MSAHTPNLRIEEVEDGWAIRRDTHGGEIAELRLSAEEAVQLMESAATWRDSILRRIQGARTAVHPVFAVPVERFDLPMEVLRENVLLAMIPPSGSHVTYSLAPRMALQLAEALRERTLDLAAGSATKQ